METSTVIIIGAIVIGGYFLFFAPPNGFSDDDLKNIKSSIKSEFEERYGITVQEVTMLKEGPNKASGFARIKMDVLGEMTKPCSATMAVNGRNYISRCD